MMGTAVTFWSPMPDYTAERLLRAQPPCRLRALADTINVAYFFVLILGVGGFVLTVREPRTWPVGFWLVFLPGVTVVLFFALSTGRFRLPVMPVLMADASACWVRLQTHLGESGVAWRRRERTSYSANQRPP